MKVAENTSLDDRMVRKARCAVRADTGGTHARPPAGRSSVLAASANPAKAKKVQMISTGLCTAHAATAGLAWAR